MRVLQLCAHLDMVGGVESYLRRLVTGLDGRGHASLVLGGAGSAESWPSGGAGVGLVPGCQWFGAPEEATDQVLDLAEEFRPDVVHVHEVENFGLVQRLAARWPTLKHAHVDFTCAAGGRRYFRRSRRACSRVLGPLCLWHYYAGPCGPARSPLRALAGYRRARKAFSVWRGVRRVIANSEHLRQGLKRAGLRPETTEVLHYFVPAAGKSGEKSPDGGEVLFVGRIVPGKGLEDLLRALARMETPARLTVVGDGFARRGAERAAGELGLARRVEFASWQDDVEPFYRRASVLVVPSLWPEPFGIVGIEAMARALPVVAYRSGGIPEWLEDGRTGMLCEPGDINGLAESIDAVLSEPGAASRMGKAGQERQRRLFSPEPHLERLEEIYREVVDTHG